MEVNGLFKWAIPFSPFCFICVVYMIVTAAISVLLQHLLLFFFALEQIFLWSLQFHLAKLKNPNYLFPAAPQTWLDAKLLWLAEPVAQSRWDWWNSMPLGLQVPTLPRYYQQAAPHQNSVLVYPARESSTDMAQCKQAPMASSLSPLWLMRLIDC